MNKVKLNILKPNQEIILILLYRFRYLQSTQIQKLLNHKYKERVRVWLNDLTQKKYIYRFYNQNFAGSPAVYCLDIKARKYFLDHSEIKDINIEQLSRVYKEKKLSLSFQKHCVFLADIYLSLLTLTGSNNATLNLYTKTDLYKMTDLISPCPDAYFSIFETRNKSNRYFLDVFDESSQIRDFRRRVRQYYIYYLSGDWQNNNKNPFPIILFVLFDNKAKNYMKHQIKKSPAINIEKLQFYVSSWGEIQTLGLCKQALYKVT